MRERPKPGAYVAYNPPAAFFPCPEHPLAEMVTVLDVREVDGRVKADMLGPHCVECGHNPHEWHDDHWRDREYVDNDGMIKLASRSPDRLYPE